MIIKKIDNITYQIKLPNKNIDIYNKEELEKITKKIFKQITKNNKLNYLLTLDIYEDKLYGTIIILKSYRSMFNIANEYEVKIHVHIDPIILYKNNYFTLNKKYGNIYYYKNNYYLEIKNNIKKQEYYKILESSDIIFEDTEKIINEGIKINI